MTQILNGSTTSKSHVEVKDRSFALVGPSVNYRFHVDADGQLVHDHFGAPADALPPSEPLPKVSGWGPLLSDEMRELPDAGRGDLRLPALHIMTGAGHTVTDFQYVSHEVVAGKPKLEGLPATWGDSADVSTVIVQLEDKLSSLKTEVRYSVFPKYNAIAKSYTVTNNSDSEITIQRAASFTLNLEAGDWDMVQLSGDWAREATQTRRSVHIGTQGFQSLAGYSSHMFNPFVALVDSTTTETTGDAYGLSFVYSGSFAVEVEKYVCQRTRANIGLNPLHLDWKLAPGKSFTTPEAVAVFSEHGLGGMSRCLHGLYRNHLSRSQWTHKDRPVLLNSWEGLYFDFDAEKLYEKAKGCADVGVHMYVMDDGWFGNKHPRLDDHAGLGDWEVNKKRFPDGLGPFVDRVNSLKVAHGGDKLKFGIWVEPEMVNPESDLYEAHPDWVLHAGKHKRTEQRNQLVLNLARSEVQDYLIKKIGDILASANIAYVKWDNNRAMHELPSPSTAHAYMLGLYRVIDSLTTRFPDILWEGCASGGGRFDPGLLYYWPQSWTSDDTDALERLSIQFGTSLVYPASSMGCHISACPSHQNERTTPLEFRAHVALMGGSFGFELDFDSMSKEELAEVPKLVALAEKVNPYVIHGEQYRLALPLESNWPAVMYTCEGNAVLLAYQKAATFHTYSPALRLQGLDASARYEVDGKKYTGAALMSHGLRLHWKTADYQSKLIFVNKL